MRIIAMRSSFDCDLLEAIADANRRWGAQTGLGHAEAIENWLALTPIERAAAASRICARSC